MVHPYFAQLFAEKNPDSYEKFIRNLQTRIDNDKIVVLKECEEGCGMSHSAQQFTRLILQIEAIGAKYGNVKSTQETIALIEKFEKEGLKE